MWKTYHKSYEEIDVFLKQFSRLKHVALGELKRKSGKNLFKKLNEDSKNCRLNKRRL